MGIKMNVICFSGTGNTEFIVNKIIEHLREGGRKVSRKSERKPYIQEKDSELLLAFPVNAQSVSPYIWKYMKSLPEGNGAKVYVVITMNESAVILKPLKKLLEKKGYEPQGSVSISMPNHLVNGQDNTANRTEAAITKAGQFADAVLKNHTVWEEDKGSSFVSFLSRKTNLPWVSMRLMFKLEVDKDKCIKCGLCVKECPVGNIRMEEFPVHKGNCQFCMHCGVACKKEALRIKGKPDMYVRNVVQDWEGGKQGLF